MSSPDTEGVAENSLEKVLRLTAVPVKSFTRVEDGKVQRVRQYQQNRKPGQAQPAVQTKFGTPYRLAWGKVAIGDVLEFGKELWKVIPGSQFPGHKQPSTRKGAGTGTGPGQRTTTTVGTGTAAAKTTPGKNTSSASSTGTASTAKVQVYQHYLMNVRTGKFEKLKLPANFVVTIIPQLH